MGIAAQENEEWTQTYDVRHAFELLKQNEVKNSNGL